MNIQLTQILFQLLNVGVVIGALNYFLYKPVLKVFDERARRIAEGQKAAQEAIEQRENIDEMKRNVQKALKKEKADALKVAHTEAEESRERLLMEAREEAQREIAKLRAEWEREREQLMSQTKEDMVRAVIQTTEKVVGDQLTVKKQEQLIDSELSVILKQI